MTERKRIFGGSAKVPGWTAFFTPAEYEHFLDLVVAHFSGLGMEARHDDGVLRVSRPEGRQDYGLGNLSQLCHMEELGEWPQVIAAHFDRMDQSSLETAELAAAIGDFDKVARLLKVRLYAESAPLDSAVARTLAPGLAEGLAYDLPSAVVAVRRDDAARWGRSEEELFRLALENVESDGLLTPQTLEVESGCRVQALVGDSFFTATHALLLDRYVKDSAEGILVAVPNRHLLLFHPVQSSAAVAAVSVMLSIARNRHQEGPGSLSPQLYWFRRERFELLPSRIEAEGLVFEPPEEFVATLEGLAAPRH